MMERICSAECLLLGPLDRVKVRVYQTCRSVLPLVVLPSFLSRVLPTSFTRTTTQMSVFSTKSLSYTCVGNRDPIWMTTLEEDTRDSCGGQARSKIENGFSMVWTVQNRRKCTCTLQLVVPLDLPVKMKDHQVDGSWYWWTRKDPSHSCERRERERKWNQERLSVMSWLSGN